MAAMAEIAATIEIDNNDKKDSSSNTNGSNYQLFTPVTSGYLPAASSFLPINLPNGSPDVARGRSPLVATTTSLENVPLLTQGARFKSFEALSLSVEQYSRLHGIRLFRSDSRTLRSAPNRANPIICQMAPAELIYYSLTYSCTYAGKSFKQFGAAKHPCRFMIRVNITRDYQQLEVTKLSEPDEHNHDSNGIPVAPSAAGQMPKRRASANKLSQQGSVSNHVSSVGSSRGGGSFGSGSRGGGGYGGGGMGGGLDVSSESVHVKHVMKTLHLLQQRNLFCDTSFLTKDTMLFAHSVVLAAVSPTLYSALNQKPYINKQPNMIDLSEYDSQLVSLMIDFFYTGKLCMSKAAALREVCARLGVILERDDGEQFEGEMTPPHQSSKENIPKGTGNVDTEFDHLKDFVLPTTTEDLLAPDDGDFASDQFHPYTDNRKKPTPKKRRRRGSTKAAKNSSADADDTGDAGRPRDTRDDLSADGVELISLVEKSADGTGYELKSDVVKKPNDKLEAIKSVSFVTASVESSVCSSPSGVRNPETIPRRAKTRNSERPFKTFIRSLNKQLRYPCQTCWRVFRYEPALNAHRWSHWLKDGGKGGVRGAERFYSCETCGETLQGRSALRAHSWAAHDAPLIAPHICTVCGHQFLFRSRMWRHMTAHVGAGSRGMHICGACDRWYNAVDFSTEHCAAHANQRRGLCGVCGKVCISLGALALHKRSHHRRRIADQRYGCIICAGKFDSAVAAALHSFTHDDADILGAVYDGDISVGHAGFSSLLDDGADELFPRAGENVLEADNKSNKRKRLEVGDIDSESVMPLTVLSLSSSENSYDIPRLDHITSVPAGNDRFAKRENDATTEPLRLLNMIALVAGAETMADETLGLEARGGSEIYENLRFSSRTEADLTEHTGIVEAEGNDAGRFEEQMEDQDQTQSVTSVSVAFNTVAVLDDSERFVERVESVSEKMTESGQT